MVKRNIRYFWIAYSIFYAYMIADSYLTPHPDKTILDFVDIPLSVTAAMGLFFYSFNKQILPLIFWKIFGLTFIVWEVTYNVVLTGYFHIGQQWNKDMLINPLVMSLALLFVLPLFWALISLGYPSFTQKVARWWESRDFGF